LSNDLFRNCGVAEQLQGLLTITKLRLLFDLESE
jgi:hypothetical protein